MSLLSIKAKRNKVKIKLLWHLWKLSLRHIEQILDVTHQFSIQIAHSEMDSPQGSQKYPGLTSQEVQRGAALPGYLAKGTQSLPA